MTQARGGRIIFIAFIDAIGGVERLGLDLSTILHPPNVPHTLACFRLTIDLQSYADWPLQVQQIPATRNSMVEARALCQFLKAARLAGGGLPLLFDLKSAFYSGIISAGPFYLHLTDPPSLFAADICKYSPSAPRRHDRFARFRPLGPAHAVYSELGHR